ncbi:MAG TPA: hypothetical protein VK821_07420 [Dehalococcoidia bacterium]|nr:hypothetical protein [Dehalococcoidia bacterium]
MIAVGRKPKLAPRMRQAVSELKRLLAKQYPEATFRVGRSPEDAAIVHLITVVDVPDTTQVVDLVLDRVLQLQVEEKLPIHVIPMRPSPST